MHLYSPLEPPLQLFVPLMITKCAGKFTPWARVEVEQRNTILPDKYKFSTAARSSGDKPAW